MASTAETTNNVFSDGHRRMNRVIYHNKATDNVHGDADDSITASTGVNWIDPTYDAAGNMTYGPKPGEESDDGGKAHGASEAYDGLDDFGRVIDHLWTDYGPATDVDAVRIEHGYDYASNRKYREDDLAANQTTAVDIDELYSYDGMYQLTDLDRGDLNANKDGLEANSLNFAQQWKTDAAAGLDPTGNWTNFWQDDDGSGWDLKQGRTQNEANETDTITQTVDSDATFHSPADDSIAWLDVPVDNAQFISVETNRDTSAATADVIATLGEDSGTDPTVAALTLIRNQLSPNVITPQAEQASTSSFVGLAIPAGTVYAHVSVETTNAFVAPTPADSGPAQEGTSYKVNGAWNIACRDAAFLRIKRDGGSDGTVGVTFFGN